MHPTLKLVFTVRRQIHIGRGGAKTIKRAIQVDKARQWLDCRMNTTDPDIIEADPCRPFQPNQPRLPQRIYAHFHIHNPSFTRIQREWLKNHTNLLLVTVRNPIDRLVSAFRYVSVGISLVLCRKNYLMVRYLSLSPGILLFLTLFLHARQHYHEFFEKSATNLPGVKKFYACFPTPQAMAEALDPRRSTNTNDNTNEPQKISTSSQDADCRKFGLVLVTGQNPDSPMNQIARNYAYYANSVWNRETQQQQQQQQQHVAVIRTEHLWSDLTRFEVYLGGNESTYGNVPHVQLTQGSEHSAMHMEFTADAATALCCIVPNELQVYQAFVAAAVNLQSSDVRESLTALHNTCRGAAASIPMTTSGLVNWDWMEWATRDCQSK